MRRGRIIVAILLLWGVAGCLERPSRSTAWPAPVHQEVAPQPDRFPAPDRDSPPGTVFRECNRCPEMVIIEPGRFRMGSPDSQVGRGSNERPLRLVTFAASFAIGLHEVTWQAWDACAFDGFCRDIPADEGWGRDRRPVINVSWRDITGEGTAWRGFLAWLNDQVEGTPYRLPSEAEWEYAARAGAGTPFWFGNHITTAQVNFDGRYPYNGGTAGEFRAQTMPVDAFEANPFGLYNVHGNVWEWVADCYIDNYRQAPVDGRAVITNPQTCTRVVRGGSWTDGARTVRAAVRGYGEPDDRNADLGFRVARSL